VFLSTGQPPWRFHQICSKHRTSFRWPRAAVSTIICGRRRDNIGSGRRCSGRWKKMELQLFWIYFLVSFFFKIKIRTHDSILCTRLIR
jgi:hypothetical protein